MHNFYDIVLHVNHLNLAYAVGLTLTQLTILPQYLHINKTTHLKNKWAQGRPMGPKGRSHGPTQERGPLKLCGAHNSKLSRKGL